MVHPLIVIGSQGFIGSHFCLACPDALRINRQQLDLCDPILNFPTQGYRYAIIAAGVGNPKACEADPALSYQCNVAGTLKLGKELLKRGILPIFFSTDYVLNDQLQVSPLNLYGKQKAELEEAAIELDALIIRLSKVYGIEKGDGTLFDEMAMKLSNNTTVFAAEDQVFAPIFVKDVISHTFFLLEKGIRGIVSISGPRYASRLEMARKLAEKMGKNQELVQKISLDDLKDGIRRPKFLRLTSSFPALSWEEGIEKVVAQYAAK